jgi:DNA repair protein RadC
MIINLVYSGPRTSYSKKPKLLSSGLGIEVKVVTCLVLHTMASNVILVHNHLSGKLEASKSDTKITQQVKAALELFDVLL